MEKLLNITKKFRGKKVVVIGDIMLDKYIYGDVSRISPEAPVPVIKVEKEFYELGGAGNVSSNVSSLGGHVVFFGFLGENTWGKIIRKLCMERGITGYFDKNEKTICKVRLIGKNQQFVRLDYEEESDKTFSEEIKRIMIEKIQESEIVIISDYAKGAITKDLMGILEPYKHKIIIDPKPKNIDLYHAALLITPNKKEAFEMSKKQDIYLAGDFLKQNLESNVLITLGADGMALFSDRQLMIPTEAKEVYDVTGAGDSVIAATALSIAAGASLEQAAVIANHVAGIAVSKAGTYHVRLIELEKKLFGEIGKLRTIDELRSILYDLKRKQKKIVFTNGSFDILHPGHIRFLTKAKSFGDILVLGLNGDKSPYFKKKGDDRPILKQEERIEVLSALEPIDYIVVFEEDNPMNLLRELKPDIKVKGGSYESARVNEEDVFIKSYGGKAEYIDMIGQYSTTSLIEKIRGNNMEKREENKENFKSKKL